ncbi:MAG: hypothetical protein COU27_01110 [Candidatus Levybacteria bacterium CG10_big_fil_rev_8_21_14_0_10_36_7]|nr:MAG: hypothetical protein COU27_01110 [Candidatus Levybacteria bacterium CG10_big_fil_rev_8_21_14_0_10_36_7]
MGEFSIRSEKIIIWNDRKTVQKVWRLKPDVLLYSASELEALLSGKLELLEIFDGKGKKLGVASRKASHKLHLIDKVAHVFVFNSKGELFLQKRAMNKDVFPGYYAPSASGHFELNETPLQAAKRETKEEMGINAEKIKHLGCFKCVTPEMGEWIHVFMLVTNEPIKINESEISEAKFFSIKELSRIDKKVLIPALKKELKLYLKKMLKELSKTS